jgi:hypothetical protein
MPDILQPAYTPAERQELLRPQLRQTAEILGEPSVRAAIGEERAERYFGYLEHAFVPDVFPGQRVLIGAHRYMNFAHLLEADPDRLAAGGVPVLPAGSLEKFKLGTSFNVLTASQKEHARGWLVQSVPGITLDQADQALAERLTANLEEVPISDVHATVITKQLYWPGGPKALEGQWAQGRDAWMAGQPGVVLNMTDGLPATTLLHEFRHYDDIAQGLADDRRDTFGRLC